MAVFQKHEMGKPPQGANRSKVSPGAQLTGVRQNIHTRAHTQSNGTIYIYV